MKLTRHYLGQDGAVQLECDRSDLVKFLAAAPCLVSGMLIMKSIAEARKAEHGEFTGKGIEPRDLSEGPTAGIVTKADSVTSIRLRRRRPPT